MTTPVMTALNRRIVCDLNEAHGVHVTYFRDANIDRDIYALVELLNNQWTVTTQSCGGHWEPLSDFQYPYVHTRLHSHPEEWSEIVRWTCSHLVEHTNPKAALSINQGHTLPTMQPVWMEWRFGPERLSARHARDVFSGEEDFRSTLDSMIATTCAALKRAINVKISAHQLTSTLPCARR